jgi:hypothetical protein
MIIYGKIKYSRHQWVQCSEVEIIGNDFAVALGSLRAHADRHSIRSKERSEPDTPPKQRRRKRTNFLWQR